MSDADSTPAPRAAVLGALHPMDEHWFDCASRGIRLRGREIELVTDARHSPPQAPAHPDEILSLRGLRKHCGDWRRAA